ncbi:hypothetical protein GGX14DRAFT_535569 [Mycena pura]|uniref:Uncharacterized protein n=1 Tax=Mycena pura TaxID=153505 RepID=A0AAD6Y7U2_9AGAR|nr:hypothetical protein GGX14DRAFT_535569 [Mycena pura]
MHYLIREEGQGLFPCAPLEPTVVVTAQTLEFFRVAHVRCPHLAIQSFVKTLCDIHGAYKPYLCQQFSISYDVYLEVRQQVEAKVLDALGRSSDWRLKNVCLACTYELVGEPELTFRMLMTMDGNESLWRVLRRERGSEGEVDENTGDPVLAKSSERADDRVADEGYFISQDKVDEWSKERLADILPTDKISGGGSPCADRWKNMINDVTSKMWGVFDETGIFLALCHHGFVLLLVDMIKSGELGKYPLAIVDALLDTYGERNGLAYDVGCHLEITIRNSRLGQKAKDKLLKMLVGTFHGHAHNRLCQLQYLATYVEGLGLEDLEGCERFFSKSNGLAKSVRYASRFHRQQEITTYIKHFDAFETMDCVYLNYKQSLEILATEPSLLSWMRREGLDSFDCFHDWLKEEEEWLLEKKRSDAERVVTSEMDYVQKLINLSTSKLCRAKLGTIRTAIRNSRDQDSLCNPSKAASDKRSMKHAEEIVRRDLEAVQALENQLDIDERWSPTSPGWISAIKLLKEKKFFNALDSLEELIVQQIFEMTKINQSQTGYKMRRHIAKALQARSVAVKKLIARYNTAAASMDPSARQLSWDKVVEYVFLADFDFLRVTDHELFAKPWTKPSYRLAMDNYFKIQRAREKIKRLDIEIRRVVTWIADEDEFLRRREAELAASGDLGMAALVQKYRWERGCSDSQHMSRFHRLSKFPGFTGCILRGNSKASQSVSRTEDVPESHAQEDRNGMDIDEDDRDGDDEDEDESWNGEKEEKVIAEIAYDIVRLSLDVRDGSEDDE